jgi:hypothetical protein
MNDKSLLISSHKGGSGVFLAGAARQNYLTPQIIEKIHLLFVMVDRSPPLIISGLQILWRVSEALPAGVLPASYRDYIGHISKVCPQNLAKKGIMYWFAAQYLSYGGGGI